MSIHHLGQSAYGAATPASCNRRGRSARYHQALFKRLASGYHEAADAISVPVVRLFRATGALRGGDWGFRMIPNVGELFRQFRVLEKVGEGGMGEVYKARDTRLERDVALKFLTRVGRVQSEYAERLRREAKSLAALNHANIVTIYDIDDMDGTPFLVLEWVPGKALNDPAHATPFGVAQFLQVALPVAEALAAAHARGMVHRDVKPGNVLVTNEGHVKLVDFGLATFRESDPALTQTDAAVGTLAYMSPEQAGGAEVGPPSDVFSFGVLAYELLTGQRPFRQKRPAAALYAIVHEPHVPLSQKRSDLPNELVALVERCLQKDPRGRFCGGEELVQGLRRVLHGGSSAQLLPANTKTDERGAAVFRQDIRFCAAADGARIAYSVVGSGPLLVRVLGWFTHLEMEWEWPDLRLFWQSLAEKHTLVRYDGRGIGLSDPYPGAFTEETRRLDLEAVLDSVGADKVALLGISEGGWTAAAYAVDHPDRVSHLILYGAYARGPRARPGYDGEESRALITLIRKSWGRDTAGFRQIFTSQFFPGDVDPQVIAHFNELQRVSADPETAARYVESVQSRDDGRELVGRVCTPTLVVHCRDDAVVGFEEGRLLAALIPRAQFLPLPIRTHFFPTSREVVTNVAEAIARHTGAA
jgi:pimeloyl-ACP methyl ester carboxylesterase